MMEELIMAHLYYAAIFETGDKAIYLSKYEYHINADNTMHKVKSFNSLYECHEWLKDTTSIPQKEMYYAVKSGKVPGVYNSPQEFANQQKGFPNFDGRKFYTYQGASDYVNGIERYPSTYDAIPYDDDVNTQPSDSFWKNLTRFLKQFKIKSFFSSSKYEEIAIETTRKSSWHPWCYARIITDHPLIIYTDASFARKKQGCAAVIIDTVTRMELHVGEFNRKNPYVNDSQACELYAIIRALKIIDKRGKCDIEIRTDSINIVHMTSARYREHLYNNDFKTIGRKKKIRHELLFKKLFEQLKGRSNVSFTWVRGHSGEKYNCIADKIARECAHIHFK